MWRWLWLALVLTAQVVSARPTTFAWDNDPNWPPGTTVELCSNGVCASGLTGNQHTLDVPIQPGERFDVQIRAYAPGYQCGDPPVLCEYSEWTTLVQTWPPVPIDLLATWAISEKENIMREGYETFTGISQSSGSTSLTIPVNTTFAVVVIMGFASANQVSSVSIGGVSVTQSISGNRDDHIYWAGSLASPGTGTQTLAWNYTGGSGTCSAVVVYLSGVESIRDSDSVNELSGYTELNRVLDSGTSDDVLIFVSGFSSETSVIPPSRNQTRIERFNHTAPGEVMDYGYKSPSSPTTTVYAESGWGTLIGITLAPATGSTSRLRNPLSGPLYGALRGSVQ
jgi:hypothetical protein